jgi:regulator of ribosome biosynthesis
MAETDSKPSKLPVQVQKPTPYTFDLGLLSAYDPNPLLLTTAENLESDLAATARDGAQALLNQLLSTCPIVSTPAGVLLSLPAIETRLPREKVHSLPFPLPSFLFQFKIPATPPITNKHSTNYTTATPPPKRTNNLAKIRRQKGN